MHFFSERIEALENQEIPFSLSGKAVNSKQFNVLYIVE